MQDLLTHQVQLCSCESSQHHKELVFGYTAVKSLVTSFSDGNLLPAFVSFSIMHFFPYWEKGSHLPFIPNIIATNDSGMDWSKQGWSRPSATLHIKVSRLLSKQISHPWIVKAMKICRSQRIYRLDFSYERFNVRHQNYGHLCLEHNSVGCTLTCRGQMACTTT